MKQKTVNKTRGGHALGTALGITLLAFVMLASTAVATPVAYTMEKEKPWSLSKDPDFTGTYELEYYMGEKYVAIKGDANKLAKLLVEQSKDDKWNLEVGQSKELGEGYSLKLQGTERVPGYGVIVTLHLIKDGNIVASYGATVNSATPNADRVFKYKTTLAGESDVPLFATFVDYVYEGPTSDLVGLKYTWMISGTQLQITSPSVSPSATEPEEKVIVEKERRGYEERRVDAPEKELKTSTEDKAEVESLTQKGPNYIYVDKHIVVREKMEVNVPIKIKNADNIGNMDIVLTYDPKVVKAEAVQKGMVLGGAMFEAKAGEGGLKAGELGEVRISFAGATLFKNHKDDIIASINFKAIGKKGSKSRIQISAKANEADEKLTRLNLQFGLGEIKVGNLKGDVNGDGRIEAADALLALKMATGQIKVDKDVADVDGDGFVDSKDVAMILKAATGKITLEEE